jgi:hypothetical protein
MLRARIEPRFAILEMRVFCVAPKARYALDDTERGQLTIGRSSVGLTARRCFSPPVRLPHVWTAVSVQVRGASWRACGRDNFNSSG